VSQASEHDADHGQGDPGLFTAREQFVVLGQAAPGGEPCERSFHRPPTWKDMESLRSHLCPVHLLSCRRPNCAQTPPGVLDNLDRPVEGRLNPLVKAPFGISTLGPDPLEPWKALCEGSEPLLAPW